MIFTSNTRQGLAGSGLNGLFGWLRRTIGKISQRVKKHGIFGAVIDIVLDAFDGGGFLRAPGDLPAHIEAQLEQWSATEFEPLFEAGLLSINPDNINKIASPEYAQTYNDLVRTFAGEKAKYEFLARAAKGDQKIINEQKSAAYEAALVLMQSLYEELAQNAPSAYSFIQATFTYNTAQTRLTVYANFLNDGLTVGNAGNTYSGGGGSSSGSSAGGGSMTLPPTGTGTTRPSGTYAGSDETASQQGSTNTGTYPPKDINPNDLPLPTNPGGMTQTPPFNPNPSGSTQPVPTVTPGPAPVASPKEKTAIKALAAIAIFGLIYIATKKK